MAKDVIALTKQDLEELLRPTLDAEGAKIQDFSVRYLTKPGDNYGSTMLAVDVTLTPGPRTLPLVAKMLPKSAALQEIFQVQLTVRKEIDMYLLVRPAYERLQKENNIPNDKYLDVLPVCYAGRISSKSDSDSVDGTSVILQENLNVRGFETGDRFLGLNLAHCKLVVDKLARFHATAVAMKIKKPEEFKATVLRAAKAVAWDNVESSLVKPLELLPEYEKMKERIIPALTKSSALFFQGCPATPREPFATIVHIDLWTNNIMFQYGPESSRDNPTGLKFVDFQVTGYDSPARDLLFFLYSSARLDVLSENYDYFIKLYHDNFVDCLKLLGCDTTDFSFEDFLKEIEYASVVEFYHIAFMLPPISLESESAVSTDDIIMEDMTASKFGKTFFDRAEKFISDFASRKWI